MWECFVDGFTETVFHTLHVDFMNSWWCLSFLMGKKNKIVLAISHFISIQMLFYLKYSESLHRNKNWNVVISCLGIKRGIMKLLRVPSASAYLCKLPSQKRDALFSGLHTHLQVPEWNSLYHWPWCFWISTCASSLQLPYEPYDCSFPPKARYAYLHLL